MKWKHAFFLRMNSFLLKQVIIWENHLLLFSIRRKKKDCHVVPFLRYSGNVF